MLPNGKTDIMVKYMKIYCGEGLRPSPAPPTLKWASRVLGLGGDQKKKEQLGPQSIETGQREISNFCKNYVIIVLRNFNILGDGFQLGLFSPPRLQAQLCLPPHALQAQLRPSLLIPISFLSMSINPRGHW